MYNFDFLKGEELIEVFENAWVGQGNNEKNTTIALTNKRLLFLDYDKSDPRENLRVGRGVEYIRFKEVYYYIYLKDIKKVEIKDDVYNIIIQNNIIEIDDEGLYKLLIKEIK